MAISGRPLRAGHDRPGGGRPERPADRALPRRGRRLRLPRLHALPRARPQGGRGRRPRAALGDRRGRADARRPAGHLRASTSGPEPTPFQRAEQLAAEAHGAARSWFLTNGATQGNHALCLALAPLGAPLVVQRNSHASVIDGLVLSGGVPSFVAPEYERGAGHGARRHARGAGRGAARDARRARRLHRLADLLRHGRRRRRLRRGLPRRRRRRSSSTRRGARTSASTPTCRRARCSRAPTRCSPRRTRSSARSRSRRCCTSRRPAGSTPTRSRARCGSCARRRRRRC